MNFLDQSPQKNAEYIPPASAAPAGASGEDGAQAGELTDLITEPCPEGFVPRLKWHANNLRRFKDERLRSLKPWSEFADRTAFSIPGKVEAFSRANRNLAYFYSNYVFVAAMISAYVLLTNTWFLTTMVLSALALYYFRMKAALNEPVAIRGYTISTTRAYIVIAAFALLSFYQTGGSSTLFYLLLLSLGTILAHAVTRQPVQEQQFSFV